MPDVRTLLADATARAPHPDPVAAVRATVHRRTVRRRVAVAAGATLAVVAAGLVLSGPPRHRAEPATTDSSWRDYSRSDWPNPVDDPVFDRATALVHAHRDVFVGFESGKVVDHAGKYLIGFSADANPAEWADDLDRAVGHGKWTAQSCRMTAAEFDAAAAAMRAEPWPSGGHFTFVEYDIACVMMVGLDHTTIADQRYARDRWGIEVLVGQAAP